MAKNLITKKEYEKRVNIVVDYINNHLDEELNLNTLAELSHLSIFHFHRIVSGYLGESIGAYIKRMRMEAAARMLRYTNLSVEEVAYNIGYNTVSSLSKSFKTLYGVTPLEYRSNKEIFINKELEPRIRTIQLPDPDIIRLTEKRVMYIRQKGALIDQDFVGNFSKLLTYAKQQDIDTSNSEYIGVYPDDPKITEDSNMRSCVCLTISDTVKPHGKIGVENIKGGKYAVFKYRGDYCEIDRAYHYILYDWLPYSGYELRNSPMFDKYLNYMDDIKKEERLTEIYMPVKRCTGKCFGNKKDMNW